MKTNQTNYQRNRAISRFTVNMLMAIERAQAEAEKGQNFVWTIESAELNRSVRIDNTTGNVEIKCSILRSLKVA